MIAAETFEFWSTQAIASCGSESPAEPASGLSCCTRVSTSSDRNFSIKDPSSVVAREPMGRGCPGRYFPVRVPCAIGDQTI
jgi:hypothetical protein